MSFAKRKADEMQVSLAGSGEVRSEEESAVTKVQIQEMSDAGRHEQGGSGTQVMHMAVAQDSGLPLAGLNVMKMKGDGGCRYGTIHVLTTTKYIKDSSVGTDDGYVEDKGIGIGDTLLGCSTQDQAAQTDQVVILGDSQDVELWMEFKRKKMKNTVKIYTEGAGEVGEMVVDQKSNSGTIEQNMEAGEKLNRNISVREAAGNGNEFEADSEKTLVSTNKPRGFMEFESQSNRKHEGDLRTEKGPGNLKILNEKEKHFQPDEPKEWEMEFADDVITGNMDSNTREHQNNEERRINSRSLGVPTVMDRPIHEQCDDFENKFGGVFSKEISAVKVESQLDLVESISGQEVDDLKQQQTENSLSERISTEMHDTESKHLGDEKLEVSGKKVIETLCNVKMLETELLDVSEDTGSQKPCVVLMECKTEPEHRELIVAFRNKDASISLDTETDDSYEKNPDVLGSNRKNVSKLSSAKSNPRCEKFLESAEKDASNLSEAETDSGYERYFGVLGLSKIKKTSVAKLSGNIEKQVKEAQGKKERDSSQTSDIRDQRLGENHSSITHKMEISSSKVRSNNDSVINNSIFIKTTDDGEELSKETDELGDEKQQNESARIEAEEKISEARNSRRRKMARKRSVRFEGNDYVYYGKRISLENCQDNDTSDLVMKTSSLSGILEKSSSELGKEKDQTNCSERFAKQNAVSLRSIHTRGTNRNGLQRNIPVNDDNPAIIRTPENVKKRGRKAKVKNSNDGASTTTASRQASYIAESPPTGPKDGASNAETPEDQTVAGNIGRRSRKRKIDHCENTTDDRQTSNKITSGKKRGRKKKLVESSSNEQATTKEGDKSLVLCLRCKEHFEFPSALKYHMMRAHQALWTDDCPEGKTDKEALRTIIKRVGKLYCPLCGKELRFLAYYIFHIEWCGREDEVEICSVCNKEIKCMYAVMHARAHAKQIRDEETRKNQVGVGLSAEEGTSQMGLSSKRRKAAQKALDTLSEVTHSLLNIDEGRQSRRPSKPKSPTIEFSTDEGDEETDSDSDLGSCHDISGDGKYGGNNEVRSYRDYVKGFQMFFNFRKEQESKGALFENIFPKMHSFARLELGEAENYLPKARKSPFFTARKEKSLISLPLFHVNSSSDNNFNIFVGGPIWSAAWCPVPCTSKTGQYMAIYCHREMKEMHQTAESFKQESLIQIWDCGPLSSTSTNEQKPFFAFGIAHDYGCVYDMSWCPARAYQVSQQPQQDVTASRQIGLLAAACSDGTVRIFSIPYPGDLIKENKERPILYRIQPSATLHHQNDNSGCCLCVDWGHGSDHRFILGGYPAGIVKLWDLKTKSPLLFTAGSDGLVVYPCSSFQCHLQDVTSCRWSMSMPDYFATCSVDRCVKIWNMNDVTHPVCHEYYSRCNAVQWTHCWSGVFLSQDDCYCLEHCCVYYQDCASGGTDTKRPILWHNTAIWDLSYSNWLNVVVSCDNQGLVNMYCCPVLTKIGLTKRTSTRRKTLFTSHVKDRKDCTPDNWGETSKSPNDASTVVTPVGKNENSLLNNDVIVVQDSNDSQNLDSSMIQSYEDMMQRYCLQYDDRRQNSTLEGKAATLPKDMTKDFPQNFPVRAIYKIQMNPNFQSCTWLLTGGQAGIVRLINVSELLHKNAVQQVEPN